MSEFLEENYTFMSEHSLISSNMMTSLVLLKTYPF